MQRPKVEALSEEDGNRQLFAVGPLEPGFGHTLGNSLRRTLLSSIPGAAVTQVRFDEALHEFDTIKGVAEGVTDVILNLKDLVLLVHSDEPVTLRLDARGPKDVSAADISLPSDVEILNPDLHIASVNGSGRLAIDITVSKGRGYVSADRNKSSSTIGVIPVDSIFSPVRRVTFTVEPTTLEESTEFDRLVLDIETDGSISAREALGSAGATIATLATLVAEVSSQPEGLKFGELDTRATDTSNPELLVQDLDLSERPRTLLRRAQVDTIDQLLDMSEGDLLAITNFEQKSLDEVTRKLEERGLQLRRHSAQSWSDGYGPYHSSDSSNPYDIRVADNPPFFGLSWPTRLSARECIARVAFLAPSYLDTSAPSSEILPAAEGAGDGEGEVRFFQTIVYQDRDDLEEVEVRLEAPAVAEAVLARWGSEITKFDNESIVRFEFPGVALVWEYLPDIDASPHFGVIVDSPVLYDIPLLVSLTAWEGSVASIVGSVHGLIQRLRRGSVASGDDLYRRDR